MKSHELRLTSTPPTAPATSMERPLHPRDAGIPFKGLSSHDGKGYRTMEATDLRSCVHIQLYQREEKTVDDALHAVTFLLIFAAVVTLYGIAMAKTGNMDLVPLRVRHSIGDSDDVRHLGRIVMRVGAVMLAILALISCILRLG